MAIQDARFIQTFYSGTPAEKLAVAEALFNDGGRRWQTPGPLADELEQLRRECHALDSHMQSMDLGRLCAHCAAGPGGGCCSAAMADNTDAIQILINLLLGVAIERQLGDSDSCCFLGPKGCLYPIKPIFCLNYNCTRILNGAKPDALKELYRRAAAVLCRQTRIEESLLKELGNRPLEGVYFCIGSERK